MLQNFADSILKDEKLVVTGEEGSNTLEITNAAYLSAWNNKTIQLPIDSREYEMQLEIKMKEEML
jgi:hypothetical protein